MKKAKGNGKTGHWKLVEQVVALLEQAIAPGARVEHDVQLLDYEAGVMRQCDVVIRQGKPPRETVTIVEVQDRSRRVTLPVFEGWWRKREKVRAQHLICVSQRGFSRSVAQEAARQGTTVQLMELRELEETAWPVKFPDGKLNLFWPEFEIDSFTVKTVNGRLPGETFKRGDVTFERNGQMTQIGTIFDEHFPTIDCPNLEGEFKADQRIEFGRDDVVIMKWADDWDRVDWVVRHVKVKARRSMLTMSASEYTQYGHEGALAWTVTGTGDLNGQDATLRVIFMPHSNGLLRPAGYQLLGSLGEMPIAGVLFMGTTSTAEPAAV